MAITNAQQARQLYNKGGPMRKIKGQDHMLAYITPGERDTLVDLGGQETMTPEGILAYPPPGEKGGPGSGSEGRSLGGNKNPNEETGGNKRTAPDPQDPFFQTRQNNPPTTKPRVTETKDKDKEDKKPFQFPSTIKLAQKGINRLMKNQLMRNRIDYFKKYGLYDEEEGIKDLPPELQALADQDLLYTDEALKEIQKMGGTDKMQKFEDFMFEDKGSPGLKFSGNVGGLGVRSAVRDVDGNIIGYKFDEKRGDGEGSNLLPPVIAQAPSITEPTEYVNPLSLLTPRIAGTRFLGTQFEDEEDTEFAADGGRIGAMGGGIMNIEDLDREAFLLGGIAKGLKKAVRGVKKIVKSPLGKAALIGAGFGLAGMGPFKGLANTSFGQGLAGLRGTLLGQAGSRVGETFVPFKEGLLTKLGLTKGGGSFMPTFKGGITLASILPLLVGKTDEEKDDILKDYYASQQLTPSTTKRQMGSEFDFYNYNLAEGGMPSKEPVAKKVMPLLDMDGMEKDYRADGGFVPLGRMEKADDVPARLSKNEFVFTADAVRNAGEGDVDKGAEVMYNMMKNLEAGGEVSEESQGLDGAREMFQTSQRLGEVI